MRILVTGARSPISADIARVLGQAGHQVWMTDCLRLPIGRFSPASSGYLRLPSPRLEFKAFAKDLALACERLAIDLIVPTCEEVFWLAAVERLPPRTGLRSSSRETLALLHNKYEFAKLARKLGYGAKENILLMSRSDALAAGERDDVEKFVAKPVFSRFATDTKVRPTREQIRRLDASPANPWLLQERAVGPEYCLYNLAHKGNLMMHVAYTPEYRAGKGASVYFDPVVLPELEKLAADFIAATSFTGQISFDVIQTESGLVALECNPRGTSGVHLAAQYPEEFAAALLGKGGARKVSPEPRKLGLPLLIYHPGMLLSQEGRRAYAAAKDAMKWAGIPLYGQIGATLETVFNAAFLGRGILQSTTRDIEWNGEHIFDDVTQ